MPIAVLRNAFIVLFIIIFGTLPLPMSTGHDESLTNDINIRAVVKCNYSTESRNETTPDERVVTRGHREKVTSDENGYRSQ